MTTIPNVGVTCNVEDVRYGGLWTENVAMVPMTYVQNFAIPLKYRGGFVAPVPCHPKFAIQVTLQSK